MILTKNFGALATLGGKGNAGALKLRNLVRGGFRGAWAAWGGGMLRAGALLCECARNPARSRGAGRGQRRLHTLVLRTRARGDCASLVAIAGQTLMLPV